LVDALADLLQQLADDRPRVLVLGGRGPTFCAGADIKWMQMSQMLPPGEVEQDALNVEQMLRMISEFPAPVMARVHGVVAGGGNGLVAAADIAVASDDAVFMFSEVKLGIVPAVIAPYVVRKIGVGRSTALWLTAERFDALAAERYGLVHRVVTGDDLDRTIDDTVALLREGSPAAQLEARWLARHAISGPGNEMAAHTAALNARLRLSPEGREGMAAFLERRKPGWAE
jgi:methylglutaconyl-CoA hydratase